MHTIVPIEQVMAVSATNIVAEVVDGVEVEYAVDEYGRRSFSRLNTTDLAEYLKY